MVSAKVTAVFPAPAGARPISAPFDTRRQVVGHHEGDAEARFEVGLIPAGEGPPGVGGLELGGGDHLLPPVHVGEGRTVETPQLIVEHPAEAAVQPPFARLQRPVQREGGPLLILVVLHLGVDPLGARPDEPGLVDLQLGGVQHHPIGGFRHFRVTTSMPVKAASSKLGSMWIR